MINGAEVDITDTGIDLTFLEDLPDDMREEVLNQHFREQRPVREELSVPVPSSISTDFLDALPPLKSGPRLFALKLPINSAVVANIKPGTLPRRAAIMPLLIQKLTRPFSLPGLTLA